MKLTKKELGEMGEQIAADYLVREGYEILERNWRFSRAEIDLIVRKADYTVIVEVKTGRSAYTEDPAVSIYPAQMQRLADCFAHYAQERNCQGPFRFDVIGIHMEDPAQPIIRHYEDVWWPQ